jgi:hypothetical protein
MARYRLKAGCLVRLAEETCSLPRDDANMARPWRMADFLQTDTMLTLTSLLFALFWNTGLITLLLRNSIRRRHLGAFDSTKTHLYGLAVSQEPDR